MFLLKFWEAYHTDLKFKVSCLRYLYSLTNPILMPNLILDSPDLSWKIKKKPKPVFLTQLSLFKSWDLKFCGSSD